MSWSILVVDDDPDIRRLLCLLLEIDSFTTVEAKDGVEALKKVQHHRPDAVILDAMMPGMDGFEVCQALRNQAETAELPIIMFSGNTEKEALHKGICAGATKYLFKGSFDHLIESIKEIFNSI